MKMFDGWSQEQIAEWINRHYDDPAGCGICGAMAGCCTLYPNCPGNLSWKDITEEINDD